MQLVSLRFPRRIQNKKKARDRLTGDVISLKRLRADIATSSAAAAASSSSCSPGLPASAIREVSLLSQLDHPNIVKLRDVLWDRRRLYLIMECADVDLRALLDVRAAEGRPLPRESVARYCYQVLSGLAHAHGHGILHRDVKPQNVLVCGSGGGSCKGGGGGTAAARPASAPPQAAAAASGGARPAAAPSFTGRETLKLADFGLSRTFSPSSSGGGSSNSGRGPSRSSRLGAEGGGGNGGGTFGGRGRPYTREVVTLWYRAPELLLGERAYSTPVDVWAAGCMLAEMATCRPLFAGDSELGQLLAIFRLLGTPTTAVAAGAEGGGGGDGAPSPSPPSPPTGAPGPSDPNDPRGFRRWPGLRRLPDWQPSFPRWRRMDLRALLGPSLGEQGLDLLEAMLAFDPRRRVSARAALAHPFFDGVRAEAEAEVAAARRERAAAGGGGCPSGPRMARPASAGSALGGLGAGRFGGGGGGALRRGGGGGGPSSSWAGPTLGPVASTPSLMGMAAATVAAEAAAKEAAAAAAAGGGGGRGSFFLGGGGGGASAAAAPAASAPSSPAKAWPSPARKQQSSSAAAASAAAAIDAVSARARALALGGGGKAEASPALASAAAALALAPPPPAAAASSKHLTRPALAPLGATAAAAAPAWRAAAVAAEK